MKIIAINGGRNSKKNLLAMRLAQANDCIFIKPYTDKRILMKSENYDNDECIHLNTSQLLDKMEREVPLVKTKINNHRYVYFENQLKSECVVLIGDDTIIKHLKDKYTAFPTGDLVTVRCHSNNEEPSTHCQMGEGEYDFVFHYENDDFEEFKGMVL